MRQDISSLGNTVKDNNDQIWEAINKLNQRTTDNDGTNEFNFGYKNGCYGYYVDGMGFQPF